jgi:hypothetical protein
MAKKQLGKKCLNGPLKKLKFLSPLILIKIAL